MPSPPSPAPSPVGMLSALRPGGGGDMSHMILLFLAGLGFKDFARSVDQLRGSKDKGDKNSQAGSLIQSLGASRAMPQGALTPGGGGGGLPPMLAGGSSPSFMALLARLAAAANRGSQ